MPFSAFLSRLAAHSQPDFCHKQNTLQEVIGQVLFVSPEQAEAKNYHFAQEIVFKLLTCYAS